jgi:signal transduction histidine kinase
MRARKWRSVLWAGALLGVVAALALSFRLPPLQWQSSARWHVLYESFGAFVALEVAAFALSRFWLEGRRLPLFIGLAYLGAAISDAMAAVVSQGIFFTPLAGQTMAGMGVWTAGRLAMAGFLFAGLVAQRYAPVSSNARRELWPAVLMGGCAAFVIVQLGLMVELPGSKRPVFGGVVNEPWQLGVGVVLAAALPGYWWWYRRLGGWMIGSVLVTLVLAVFAQAYMARSVALYDGWFNLATVLKVGSYLPLLAGLFVESVVLFRAQKKLTVKLEVAQAELREYSRGLEQKVAERTRELEARARELEAFAYTVSHDLKAPLRGVQTYSQRLLEEYAARLDATGRRYAESLGRAAASMKQLIDDLLEYSRLQRRETQLGRVDVRQLVESVLTERRADIERLGVQVELAIDSSPIVADRAMLRQAIANLIDNAIKFSRNARPPRVSIRGLHSDSGFELSVSDNGVGFDPRERDRIFEIFQRLHRPEEFEGTGIGLSIVKRAIEKHGGSIRAESTPGHGATFSFTLPQPGPPTP